jgi:hypothetical protein
MLVFYLPVIWLDNILAIFEANNRTWEPQMPALRVGKPTVIMLE